MRRGDTGVLGLVLVALCTAPAAAQVVRVSVATDGTQANGRSYAPSMSASGRFVAFASEATNLVAGDTNGMVDVFLRDRDTDADGVLDEAGAIATTRINVGAGGVQAGNHSFAPVVTADGRYVFFSSSATNLVEGVSAFQVYRFDRQANAVSWVGVSEGATMGCGSVAASDNGRYIVVACSTPPPGVDGVGPSYIYSRDLESGQTTLLSLPQPGGSFLSSQSVGSPTISGDGRLIGFAEQLTSRAATGGYIYSGSATLIDRTTGVARRAFAPGYQIALARDGRNYVAADAQILTAFLYAYVQSTELDERVLFWEPPSTLYINGVWSVSRDGRYVATRSNGAPRLYDTAYRLDFPLPYGMESIVFDGPARTVAFTSSRNELPITGGDTNGADDVFVADLRTIFDADQDTLDDRDETFFGLSPAWASGADGANGDPDGDGLTNAQEIAAGTHPNATQHRYLAEGAQSAFFQTRVVLVNSAASGTASALVRFQRHDGTVVATPMTVPAMQRRTVLSALVPELQNKDFSIVVDSNIPLVVDRTMTWASGTHGETAVPAPSPTWYLAEGTTVLDFELFYLLQNPGDTATAATVRFLRPSGAPLVRQYGLAPHSRTTIYVNQIASLEETDVSGEITATAPIVVERALYRSRPGEIFTLGHDAHGQTATTEHWFLAEGATGSFFDTYVLIANPGATPVDVTASFLRDDGMVVTRTYTLRANARFSIYVDAIPGLEATSLAATIDASGPVVVERAMYWPTGFFEYYEGHVSGGATATGSRWILAEGESGGAAATDTYVLIANTGATAATATVRPLVESAMALAGVNVAIPAHSRVTVRVGSIAEVGTRRHGVEVLETGTTLTGALVVEGAMYGSPDGVLWSSGTGWLATRVQ